MSDLSVQEQGNRAFAFVLHTPTGTAVNDLRTLVDRGWDPAPLFEHLGTNDPAASAAAFVAGEADTEAVAPYVSAIAAAIGHPSTRVRDDLVCALLRQPASLERDVALLRASAHDTGAATHVSSWSAERRSAADAALHDNSRSL